MNDPLPNYVSTKEVSLLTHTCQVAWAATVWESVLRFFSPYFRTHFRQDEAVALAWTFVETSSFETSTIDSLQEAMAALLGEAEDEGYGNNGVLAGLQLTASIRADHAADCARVVGHAAVMYAAQCLYRAGGNLFDPSLSYDVLKRLSAPVYELARDLFDLLQNDTSARPLRSSLGTFGLRPPQFIKTPGSKRVWASTPPKAEEKYLASLR